MSLGAGAVEQGVRLEAARVDAKMSELGLTDLGSATIRLLSRLARELEAESGMPFIHMEMGVPGLEPSSIGRECEVRALVEDGVAQFYPPIEGFPGFKAALRDFVKAFLDVDVAAEGCIPTVGSMQGSMAAFTLVHRSDPMRNRILFLDPGFPVQKQQIRMLGATYDTFDVYAHRGAAALGAKIEEVLKQGRTRAIVYSSPNNPSWISFTEEELAAIGELARRYDAIVIEDLAYCMMDFRSDTSVPYRAPYQPTVARYTSEWVLLFSASKMFSYAGQRVGGIAISDALFGRRFENLGGYFPSDQFGRALVYGALYAFTSGVCASAQRAFEGMLRAATSGEFRFVEGLKEYERRAVRLKEIFNRYGFELVYDRDGESPLADGFYFTLRYPGLSGHELLYELLLNGISAISLGTTGSDQGDGLRACVSQIAPEHYALLEARLADFASRRGGR